MEIELLSSKSVSHTVYVLNHALIKAKIELDAGNDSIKPFKTQKILDDMVKDLIKFGKDKNKDRANIMEKVKLVSDKITSDVTSGITLPKINEGVLDEMEQVRNVIEIIISGKISKLEQNEIDKAQRVLWNFFCQVREIPNRLE